MLTLISPAKSLDFTSKFDCKNHSLPHFKKETNELIKNLKKAKVSDLEKVFNISKKLAELNFERFQNFLSEFNLENSRQALLAFDGDVYDGFDKNNFSTKDFDFAQKHLRILSGLYGILKPLDLIQPYRLEMGCDFKKFNAKIKNLYEFWQEKIAVYLNEEEKNYIINLASEEYFSAVDEKKIKANIINVIFKEEKNGVLKIIGINAKKARGLMANYIIKNQIDEPNLLKKFSENNYKFSPKLSDERNFVFIK